MDEGETASSLPPKEKVCLTLHLYLSGSFKNITLNVLCLMSIVNQWACVLDSRWNGLSFMCKNYHRPIAL